MGNFTEDSLGKYLSSGKVPKQAMIWFKQLLFKEMREYCEACEEDRMLCVLSPACTERILLKVRIQTGAIIEDLPQFCYTQSVNNLRRYIEKKTTLYTPKDLLVFNQNFIDIMFPRLYSKIIKNYKKDVKKVHEAIGKSRVPAINLDLRHADTQIFRRIVEQDKLIREGSFIYDILGEFLICWFDGDIFISNFENDITICNAKNDVIEDLKMIDLAFQIYCAEHNVSGSSTKISENHIQLDFVFPFAQIAKERLTADSTYFIDLLTYFQQYFYHIQIKSDDKDNFILSLHYNNREKFLKNAELSPITYDIVHQSIIKMNEINKAEEE